MKSILPAQRRPPRRRRGQRGAILLLVLLMTGVLTLASVSFTSSVASQAGVARDASGSLRAELAAGSGLDYARRRLADDPLWEGTDPGGIDLGGGANFIVTRLPGEGSLTEPSIVDLVVEGREGGSRFRLAASVAVSPGDELRTKAIAPLGEDVDIHHSAVTGDLILPDDPAMVFDWNPALNGGEGGWQPSPVTSASGINLAAMTIDGTLWKYTSQDYVGGSIPEKITHKPLRMPQWNLDSYLTPGPDRLIYNNPSQLKNLNTSKTVVVKYTGCGSSLTIDNCTITGGVVIYAKADADLRDDPKVEVTLKKHNVFGGGTGGIHPSIGFLAPSSELKGSSGLGQEFLGLTFIHSMQTITHGTVDGQFICVGHLKNMNNFTVVYDPEVTDNPPPGIVYAGPPPSVDVGLVSESYD